MAAGVAEVGTVGSRTRPNEAVGLPFSAHASGQAQGLWQLLSLEVGAGLGPAPGWDLHGLRMLQDPLACVPRAPPQSPISSAFEPWFLGPDPAPLKSQLQWKAEVASEGFCDREQAGQADGDMCVVPCELLPLRKHRENA